MLDAAIEAEAQAQAICMQTRDFERAYRAFLAKRAAGVRGRLMPTAVPALAVPRRRAPALADELAAWALAEIAGLEEPARRTRRSTPTAAALVARARATAAGSTHAVGRAARRAHALPRARDARLPRRAGRLRVRDAGPRHRRDLAVRRRRAARSATCRASPTASSIAAFALSEPEAGSDVARCDDRAARRLGRLDPRRRRRRGSPTAGSPTSTPSSRARRGAGARASARSSSTPTRRLRDRRAHRRDRAAPARHARASTARPREPARPARARACKIALATLDVFRSTVGAAALGLRPARARRGARRASSARELFGAPMAELPLVQAKLAEMALGIDASALLVYRAAWTKDVARRRA